MNERFGKDFYRKDNSVKRSKPFNEPPIQTRFIIFVRCLVGPIRSRARSEFFACTFPIARNREIRIHWSQAFVLFFQKCLTTSMSKQFTQFSVFLKGVSLLNPRVRTNFVAFPFGKSQERASKFSSILGRDQGLFSKQLFGSSREGTELDWTCFKQFLFFVCTFDRASNVFICSASRFGLHFSAYKPLQKPIDTLIATPSIQT